MSQNASRCPRYLQAIRIIDFHRNRLCCGLHRLGAIARGRFLRWWRDSSAFLLLGVELDDHKGVRIETRHVLCGSGFLFKCEALGRHHYPASGTTRFRATAECGRLTASR